MHSGVGEPCKPSLSGVYCTSCAADSHYYDRDDAACKPCEAGNLLTTETVGLGLLLCALAAAVGTQCLASHRASRAAAVRRAAECARRSGRSRGEVGASRHSPRGSASPDTDRAAREGPSGESRATGGRRGGFMSAVLPVLDASRRATANRDALRSLQLTMIRAQLGVKARLLVSFLQVTMQLQEVYLLTFPSELTRVLRRFEWLLYPTDLLSFGVPLDCLGLASFRAKLVATAATPAALLAGVFLTSVLFPNPQYVLADARLEGLAPPRAGLAAGCEALRRRLFRAVQQARARAASPRPNIDPLAAAPTRCRPADPAARRGAPDRRPPRLNRSRYPAACSSSSSRCRTYPRSPSAPTRVSASRKSASATCGPTTRSSAAPPTRTASPTPTRPSTARCAPSRCSSSSPTRSARR